MACLHPLPAWRTRSGEITLAREPPHASTGLRLPCGNCLGCRTANARAWALRCQLELQNHTRAAWTTLTYSDEKLPPTLDKRHVQLFIRKLRKRLARQKTARPLRFFASGEYGEQTQRPHYHAILYGIDPSETEEIDTVWGLGHTRTEPITPARIAYTAGYCAKKIGYLRDTYHERVDPHTGEVYHWQPPFIQMSRRPGIGASARAYARSWRMYAISNGIPMPVPRYLHEAWKAQATEQQKTELLVEKANLALRRDTTKPRLEAQEKIEITNQQLKAARRHYK